MIKAIIFTGPIFTVTSYGNGLSYLIKRRDGGGELLVHGDDAAAFREEWTSVENAYPHLDTDTIIRTSTSTGVLRNDTQAGNP